jgi:hypothetical protein
MLGCQNSPRSANHFRLTAIKSPNTEKLFSSPSRDREYSTPSDGVETLHSDKINVTHWLWKTPTMPARKHGAGLNRPFQGLLPSTGQGGKPDQIAPREFVKQR